MFRVLLKMLDLLLTIKHLPALDTKYFAIGLLFYVIKFFDEGVPLRGISFDHLRLLISF